MVTQTYPKPLEYGGRLARELVRACKAIGFASPITSHIHIATSGGLDSTALAVLLTKYGRRVVPDPKRQITLLHINHGWRGEESDADENFVRQLAAQLGVGFRAHRLTTQAPPGASWEDHARTERKRLFRCEADENDAWVFTAHTADDVAETLLWRIFTGAFEKQRAGILAKHGPEIRPLLAVKKADLRNFLAEERQGWREDRTNHEGRFLRSRIRQELIPAIERLFPAGIEHLLQLRQNVKTPSRAESDSRATSPTSP